MGIRKERIEYLDILRILSTYAVIIIHLSGFKELFETGSLQWWGSITYNAIMRWAVPVFVMISGALFVGREIPLKKLYGKYILRIATAYIFWAVIYAFINDPEASPVGFIVNVVYGNYHMWFLYMIAGLYISLPIINMIAKSKQVLLYFCVISVIVSFAIPQIIALSEIAGYPIDIIASLLTKINTRLRLINLFGGFATYFLLGHYIVSYGIPALIKKLIYVGGIISLIVTVVGYGMLCSVQNTNNEIFTDYLSVNVFLTSISVFVFASEKISKFYMSDKLKKIVFNLSKYSFGVYLIHALLIHFLYPVIEKVNVKIGTAFSIPIVALLILIIGFVFSYVINHIPVLKKYIV